jgi:phosphate:Na+ symporter
MEEIFLDITNMIIGLIGGLGLFLYGMKLMGEGFENIASNKIKSFFEKIASNPIKAVFTGSIITAVIQSSSAATVMVVGFVNAGLMSVYQSVGVIMGANIGTTITAQIISFKLDEIVLLLIGIGSFTVFFSKEEKIRELGKLILGLGIIFLGMVFLKDTMEPLGESDYFRNLMISLKGNIFLGIVVGTIMTSLIQSSSASMGMLIALAVTGVLPIEVAIPILFGINIGTCTTALISSIGTSRDARKTAVIHLLFNVIGTIIFIPASPLVQYIVEKITPHDISRQIANVHTIFNVVNTAIMLPFINYLILLSGKVVKGEDNYTYIKATHMDDRILETPTIAVGQAINEIVIMGNKAKENLAVAMEAFNTGNEELIKKVYENEKLINLLENEITTFLVKLSNIELLEEQKNKVVSMFHVVNDIERIGDHCENIAELTLEKINKRLKFSDEAIDELKGIYNYTLEALSISIESFKENDIKKARLTLEIEQNIDNLEQELRIMHISRLSNGYCYAHSGAIFLDIINNFERIGDHSTNIAEYTIQNEI